MRLVMLTLRSVVAFALIAACSSVAPADNLPLPPGEARTPETRTLSVDETAHVLERDWLFQAMGEPLLPRAAKEIVWTQELAVRLSQDCTKLDLSSELQELTILEKRLAELLHRPTITNAVEQTYRMPSWIWYPEGRSAEDAPAETRFFRRRFESPAGIRSAVLRIAVDDACEVFVNGHSVGAHET